MASTARLVLKKSMKKFIESAFAGTAMRRRNPQIRVRRSKEFGEKHEVFIRDTRLNLIIIGIGKRGESYH
jgi:hypothetical protein